MTLWNWYMVYAAAFGISEKVAREFARAYPEVNDPQWLDTYGYDSLGYWTYRSQAWNGPINTNGMMPVVCMAVRNSWAASVTSVRRSALDSLR